MIYKIMMSIQRFGLRGPSPPTWLQGASEANLKGVGGGGGGDAQRQGYQARTRSAKAYIHTFILLKKVMFPYKLCLSLQAINMALNQSRTITRIRRVIFSNRL